MFLSVVNDILLLSITIQGSETLIGQSEFKKRSQKRDWAQTHCCKIPGGQSLLSCRSKTSFRFFSAVVEIQLGWEYDYPGGQK
jgi:hypothetical protein